MDDDKKQETPPTESEVDARLKARREFVKKFGKCAAAVPAVTLLLSAGTKKTHALVISPD